MTTTTRPMTAEEFFTRASEFPRSSELVLGEVISVAPPGDQHADLAAACSTALRPFARKHKLGRVGVEPGFRLRTEPDTVRGPDVSFVSFPQFPRVPSPGWLDGAPTLAVEIKSPGDREGELMMKVGEYLNAGAARVWVVRPEHRATTVHAADGGTRIVPFEEALNSEDAGFTVDGFELRIAEEIDW